MVHKTPTSLDDYLAQVKALVDALIAGEKSGLPRTFDNEAFLKRMRERHG
ncbi:Hypothetical protein NGAL_HAMBI1145_00890 [Neorhizobium galegae bv. officinalis]|uniref:Uncharacterized protein n=1 Tax=Neorhizobium galegae bv. officinalis TaxID=323656 RepID=A0A0T7F8F3_NEOGA|nr:type II toxin-antitoxin system ParD family antitoxin [Neorhizobium galegae]CDZ31328.1 Hypothetical protein NGAL_HAMBI1145_00890 [Neorhizobium galegae bv. officinalis]